MRLPIFFYFSPKKSESGGEDAQVLKILHLKGGGDQVRGRQSPKTQILDTRLVDPDPENPVQDREPEDQDLEIVPENLEPEDLDLEIGLESHEDRDLDLETERKINRVGKETLIDRLQKNW